MTRNVARLALATAAGLVCLFVNDNWSSTERSALIAQADARVGHPLTPVSVAGVHRRAARRAYRRDEDYGYGPGYGVGAGVAATGAVAAGAAATGAYYGEPPAAPYPAYPAWAPSFVHDAEVVPPGASATVTDPETGRTCTISPSGYHWCWRP